MEHKMEISSLLPSSNRRSIRIGHALVLTAVVAGAVAGYVVFSGSAGAAAQSRDKVSLKDMPSVTGTLEAARPFKAAQVYLRNVDRRMSYMVYSQAGKFRAVALLAGNYEIHAEARGLQSDVQKLVRTLPGRRQRAVSRADAGVLRRNLSSRRRQACCRRGLHDMPRRELHPRASAECRGLAGGSRPDDGQGPPRP
jgi:hypothetical protein